MTDTVRLHTIRCLEEVNEASASEEIYALITAVDMRPQIPGLPPAPNFEVFRYGIFGNFDKGDVVTVGDPACWGPSSAPMEITAPDHAAIIVSLIEQDNGTPELYQGLVRTTVGLSLAASAGEPDQAKRAARLANAIRDNLNGIDLPIPFDLDDDHIGTRQLLLDNSDLFPGPFKDKVMRIESSEGRYELVFRVGVQNPFPNWQLLDNNPATVQVVADAAALYQRHSNGAIFRFTGTPMTGWELLDNNGATQDIVASGGNLYQRHGNGFIFKYTGTPMTGWLPLDGNPATVQIVADGNALYQRHSNGAIFRFNGTPMTGWDLLDNNGATRDIAAAGGRLYQRHDNGAIFRFNGIPMTGWDLLDNNAASKAIIAGGPNLFQRHDTGAIFKSTA